MNPSSAVAPPVCSVPASAFGKDGGCAVLSGRAGAGSSDGRGSDEGDGGGGDGGEVEIGREGGGRSENGGGERRGKASEDENDDGKIFDTEGGEIAGDSGGDETKSGGCTEVKLRIEMSSGACRSKGGIGFTSSVASDQAV